jgi:hypothetical protein
MGAIGDPVREYELPEPVPDPIPDPIPDPVRPGQQLVPV